MSVVEAYVSVPECYVTGDKKKEFIKVLEKIFGSGCTIRFIERKGYADCLKVALSVRVPEENRFEAKGLTTERALRGFLHCFTTMEGAEFMMAKHQ